MTFHSWNTEKKHDIMIYGSRSCIHSKSLYPYSDTHKAYLELWKKRNNIDSLPDEINFYEFRNRIEQLLINSKKYNLDILTPHNGYKCDIRGEKLSKRISESYLCLATRTSVDKCMMKYIEIFSSDTIVLGDIPTDYKEIFGQDIVEINETMTDQQILDIIDNSLSDKKSLINKGKNIGNKIRELYGNHTSNPINNFQTILQKIINEYYQKFHKY
jgi:hypothetical protein